MMHIPTGTLKSVANHDQKIQALNGEIVELKRLIQKLDVRLSLAEAYIEESRAFQRTVTLKPEHAPGCRCSECVGPIGERNRGGRPRKHVQVDKPTMPPPLQTPEQK